MPLLLRVINLNVDMTTINKRCHRQFGIGLGQGMIFSQEPIRWDDVKDADLTAHFLIGFLLFQPIAAGHLAAAEADDV